MLKQDSIEFLLIVFGGLYPFLQCFKILYCRKTKMFLPWLKFYIVFTIFYYTRSITDAIFACWIPLYYEMQFFYVMWLLPNTRNGSGYIFSTYLIPITIELLKFRERYLDEIFGILVGPIKRQFLEMKLRCTETIMDYVGEMSFSTSTESEGNTSRSGSEPTMHEFIFLDNQESEDGGEVNSNQKQKDYKLYHCKCNHFHRLAHSSSEESIYVGNCVGDGDGKSLIKRKPTIKWAHLTYNRKPKRRMKISRKMELNRYKKR